MSISAALVLETVLPSSRSWLSAPQFQYAALMHQPTKLQQNLAIRGIDDLTNIRGFMRQILRFLLPFS